ncbi:sigma-70 family RNA polymerase sigma factor [Gemmata sp. JC717]|uniref:sigma-70 family RNA polymerase sigma factor n=1 Tax=Gemmata algarum TaxID=2975278 RepID=UPI0021BB7A92|nr:sigma-70 family RNA polymerase sigma factor [Gemmata algarum]MDY3550972.1 sigma-70 family RNA polymerase sigma factor [Gemmata algarum]
MAKQAAALLKAARSAEPDESASDKELLRRFAEAGDQSAFAALAERHAGMVFGVCKRVLHSPADAEDACQAVFLILSKRAGATRWQVSVANWLYATARKVARNARVAATRRTRREEAAAVTEAVPPADTLTGPELLAALDEELERLPPRYREPLILCYLEGLTRDEAATRLGVPVATLKSQLERGRKKLADALTARGCALGVALLLTTTSSAGASPPRLTKSVLTATNGSPSPAAAALAKEGIVNGWKLKGLLAIAAVVAGVGLATMLTAAEQPTATAKVETPAAKADPKDEPKRPMVMERTITGKVVDPDGKPHQAELLLFENRSWIDGRRWSTSKTESLGKTATDGTFSVTVPLRERGLFLIARADGFGVAFLAPTADTPTDVTFKLVKDVPVKGRVVDGAGKPVAGATVRLEVVQTFAGESMQAFLDSLPKRTDFREHPVESVGFFWHPADGPFRTKTDADGRFELTGIGGERLASLEVKATGREDGAVCVATRAGLDVKPLNEATLRLQPKTGERLTWDFNPILSAPNFTLPLEAEKPVRGRVTDAKTGKPRAGVEVTMSSDNGVTRVGHRTTTDADGRYELHGVKKLPTYGVSVREDVEGGYLPAQTEVKDTVGHEPVIADIACQRGVVVTGTVRNKATGRPVPGARLSAHVLAGNTFAKRYPSLGRYASLENADGRADGTYRILVIPGPVLLTCGNGEYGVHALYGPPKPDPAYPHLFTKPNRGEGLGYFAVSGGQGGVNGNWCKVIDAKETDTEVRQDVELEPVSKKLVKVVDADGKPAKNARATGFTRSPWHYAESIGDTDTIPVFDLEPKEKRLVVARLPEQKQVGAAEIGEDEPAPVLKLGVGGTARGRVVGADGKPAAGVTVTLHFDRREVAEIYGPLNKHRAADTGADGTFAFDELLPGYDFRFTLNVGQRQFGPESHQAPAFRIEKHGDTLKVGDLKLQPTKTKGE